MRLRSALAATLGIAALTACGPLNDGNVGKGALAAIQQMVSGPAAPAAPPAPPLSREQADANPGQFLLVTAYGGASVVSMVPVSQTGNRTTWISADNVTVTVQDGILVATRGLPRDLMAARVDGVRAALSAGGGSAQRVHETLDDLDQISTELLQCSIVFDAAETVTILQKAIPTRRFKETCQGQRTAFSNTYWIASGNRLVKTSQAVAPETGFLLIEWP